MSKKSYNYLALRGDDVDDMEYVERFNLDPSVAYTPKINDVMLDKAYKDNLEFYRGEGMSEAEAVKAARARQEDARQGIRTLLKKA